MANKVKNYSYIKRSDISVLKATIDGKVLDVDPKTILSGTYVAGKVKPTASKLRVAKTDPSSIREKLLKKYKDFAEEEYNADFEKYISVKDIQKFVECGLTEEMIMAFYGGIECVMDIKADNEFSYNPIGGVFSYRTDNDGEYVKSWVERGLYNCENGIYELGFKYPDFNWSFLKRTDNTEVISTEPYDYFGKKRVDRVKLEKFVVNDKFTLIACKSAGYSEDGVFSKYSDEMLNAGAPLELNGGYLALVSRNAKELFALAKKLLSQSKGYVKDFDWLVQGKTSGAKELKQANYKFAKGGSIETVTRLNGNGQQYTLPLPKVVLLIKQLSEVALKWIEENTGLEFKKTSWAYEVQPTKSEQIVKLITMYHFVTEFHNNATNKNVLFLKFFKDDFLKYKQGGNVEDEEYAKGGGIEKANLGALLIAEKAKGLAPKIFDSADTKIANRISRKSFAERMSETGNEEYDQNQYEANKFAKGGSTYEKGGEVYNAHILTNDNKLIYRRYPKKITHNQIYQEYKNKGVEIKDSQIHFAKPIEFYDRLRLETKKYVRENMNDDVELSSIYISSMQKGNEYVANEIKGTTISGKEFTLTPKDLFEVGYRGNSYAEGGSLDKFDAIVNKPVTYTLYQGEKVFLTTKSFNKASDTRTLEKMRGNFLTLEMKDSKNNVRIVKFSNGGGVEDDYMSSARTNARESINWNEEVRNYAGDQYDSLTEEEKDSIIAEMKANYDFAYSFAKGGKLSEAKYIPRDEIIKVELTNGKVIENNWKYPIYSGLRLTKGITEREEMEAKGQLTIFKRGGTMPKYAAYVSQRNIAKVYLHDEDEPTVVNGRDLVGGIWFDNEKTIQLIETARKQGLIK
jgi:hypothetical protein